MCLGPLTINGDLERINIIRDLKRDFNQAHYNDSTVPSNDIQMTVLEIANLPIRTKV